MKKPMYPNVDAERVRLGLSRAQLAESIDVCEKTMNNWMNGRTDPPVSKLIKMANFFNCTTDYLLGLETA